MQAVYYRAPDGSEPVDAFIERLRDAAKQAALDNQIERLNTLRPERSAASLPLELAARGGVARAALPLRLRAL